MNTKISYYYYNGTAMAVDVGDDHNATMNSITKNLINIFKEFSRDEVVEYYTIQMCEIQECLIKHCGGADKIMNNEVLNKTAIELGYTLKDMMNTWITNIYSLIILKVIKNDNENGFLFQHSNI